MSAKPSSELAAHGGEPFCRELIPLYRRAYDPVELAALEECLRSGWVTRGPKTVEFERAFAYYLARGTKNGESAGNSRGLFALGLNSCTAALHTALHCEGIGPDDEVITTPMTFAATVNVIEHVGATPVLVDIHPDTLCIDEEKIERAITNRTKAIIPVHYAGHPCELDAISDIAERHGLTVIEDCAHAVEAEYRGRKMGGFSPYSCFSFYANKNLSTGEGGMLVCRDEETKARAMVVSLHGMSRNAWQRYEGSRFELYDIERAGFKYNIFDLQAALGLVQLGKLDENWKKRLRLYERYCSLLADVPGIEPLQVRDHVKSAHHIFPCLLDLDKITVGRDEFLSLLLAENVQGYVHFRPIFEFRYYKDKYGWRAEDWPVAADAGMRVLSLPFYPSMTDEEMDSVVGAVRKVLAAVSI
ncbi:MAG: DegT/DnrJ/EryC1/StrS family aminotransferase [bacterium]|jgi:dTDP-4-amino-4,6-dideoxygalactose transaminase